MKESITTSTPRLTTNGCATSSSLWNCGVLDLHYWQFCSSWTPRLCRPHERQALGVRASFFTWFVEASPAFLAPVTKHSRRHRATCFHAFVGFPTGLADAGYERMRLNWHINM